MIKKIKLLYDTRELRIKMVLNSYNKTKNKLNWNYYGISKIEFYKSVLK